MALTETEELELLELENENALSLKSQSPDTTTTLPENPVGDKPGILSKAGDVLGGIASNVGDFVGSFGKSPIGATGGALTGAFEGIGEFGKDLLPKPSQEDLTQQPSQLPTSPTQQPSLDALDIRGGKPVSQQLPETKPFTPNQEEAFEQAKPGGKFLSKLSGGIALSTLAPGSGIGATMAQGAIANVPFVAESIGEGGLKAGATDVALNTVFDALTFGAGKALQGPKQGIKKAVGNMLQDLGAKIQMATIKPGKPILKNVNAPKGQEFQVFKENVFKHGLEGSLDQGLEKSGQKITDLSGQLQGLLKETDAKIDIADLLANVESNISKSPEKNLFTTKESKKVLDDFFDRILEFNPSGQADLLSAQQLKRTVGTRGAWLNGSKEEGADAAEAVYNLLYTEFKEAIEKAAPEGVREINKQLSEILPIEQAIISRIPVAQRQDVFSLTDIVSLAAGPKGIGLAALNKLSKSPVAGGKAFRKGEKLLKSKPTQRFKTGKLISESLKEETDNQNPNLKSLSFGRSL